jgi:large subunit ribosomal protein L4
VRALARRSALTARAGDDRVIIIDALEFERPATRRLVKYLEQIEVQGKALILTEGTKGSVVLSARNVAEIRVRPFGEESTYDILWAGTVVIERGALDRIAVDETADDGEEEAADA